MPFNTESLMSPDANYPHIARHHDGDGDSDCGAGAGDCGQGDCGDE